MNHRCDWFILRARSSLLEVDVPSLKERKMTSLLISLSGVFTT